MSKIKFGTDGWRAVISDDFTFENVKIVAQAMADYVRSQKSEDRRQKAEDRRQKTEGRRQKAEGRRQNVQLQTSSGGRVPRQSRCHCQVLFAVPLRPHRQSQGLWLRRSASRVRSSHTVAGRDDVKCVPASARRGRADTLAPARSTPGRTKGGDRSERTRGLTRRRCSVLLGVPAGTAHRSSEPTAANPPPRGRPATTAALLRTHDASGSRQTIRCPGRGALPDRDDRAAGVARDALHALPHLLQHR